MEHFLSDPTIWVGLGFFIFVGLAAWKVWPPMGKGLDDYGTKIANEIKQAEALKAEAQTLLADARKKATAAERQATEIVERAKFESKLIADEAEKEIERELERKMKMADEKISRAQEAAMENIRHKAIEQAIEAATETLKNELQTAKTSEKLVEKSLRLISSDIR